MSGSSRAEIVRESFRLVLETPSMIFAGEEEELDFHSRFREEAAANLTWLADRIQGALQTYEGPVELGAFDPTLPLVMAWYQPTEPGSLEQAPEGPFIYDVSPATGGEATHRVPSMSMLSLQLVIISRPSREEMNTLIEHIEATLAAPEPVEQ